MGVIARVALALSCSAALAQAGEPGPVVLDVEAKAEALCRAVQITEQVQFTGDAFERGMAREKHAEARTKAMEKSYAAAAVGPRGFTLGDYNAREQTFVVKGPFRAVGGVLTLQAAPREFVVAAAPAKAKAIAAANAIQMLSVQVLFRVAVGEAGPPCTGLQSKAYNLAATPLLYELRNVGDGTLYASVEMPALAEHPEALGPPTGKPKVEVGHALDGDEAIARAVAGRTEKLVACYTEALKKQPGLTGTIILAVAVDAKGAATETTFMADGLRDAPTTACVRDAVKSAAFPKAAGQAQVPLDFTRGG
jgi:hypothetical protein